MISEAVLAKAVDRGLISSGQAMALQSLARQEEPVRAPEPVDDERLRFVSGFADIFVTLGLVLFLGSLAYLAGRQGLSPGAVAGLAAATAWGLAEFFTRRRRMALPSIVLLVVFAGAAFLACASLFGATGGGAAQLGWLRTWMTPLADGYGGALAAVAAAALVALHYARFRVPISVAAGVAALASALVLLLATAWPDATARAIDLIILLTGLVTFAIAMGFDLRDPARATRRTDIAFWLHLLAAPLIVHSVFHAVGIERGSVGPGAALAILAIVVALALVALLIDRRAILVSGLTYAGVALSSLIRGIVTEGGLVLPLTLLVLGAVVLLLSAGWQPLRRVILRLCPPGLAERLPHPAGS